MLRSVVLGTTMLLEDITPGEVDAIMEHADVVSFHRGEVLFVRGDQSSSLHILLEGSLEVRRSLSHSLRLPLCCCCCCRSDETVSYSTCEYAPCHMPQERKF
jgi:hypothetical protein